MKNEIKESGLILISYYLKIKM